MTGGRDLLRDLGKIATAVPLPTLLPEPEPGRHVPAPLVVAPLAGAEAVSAVPRRPHRLVELDAADALVTLAPARPMRSKSQAGAQRRDLLSTGGEADVAAFRAHLDAEGRVQPRTAATWSYTLRQVLREGADGGALSALTAPALWAWWLRPSLSADSREHYRHVWDAVRRWRPDAPHLPAPVTAPGLGEDILLALERAGAAASLPPERLIAATWGRPLARVVGVATVGELALGLHGRELGGGAWLTGRPVVPRWIGAPDPLEEGAARELARWIGAGAAGREELRRRPARPPRRRWGAVDGS